MSDQPPTELIVMVSTTARELRALLKLVQRAPMHDFEAFSIETIFERWFGESNNQHQQARAYAAIANAVARAKPNDVSADRPILYPRQPNQPQTESSPDATGELVRDQPQ